MVWRSRRDTSGGPQLRQEGADTGTQCARCGAKGPSGTRFCLACGSLLDAPEQKANLTPPRAKSVAAKKSTGIRRPALVVALAILALAIAGSGLFVVYTKFMARRSGLARSEDQKLLQGFYEALPASLLK